MENINNMDYTTLKRWGSVFAFLVITAIITERSLKRVSDEKTVLQLKLSALEEKKQMLFKQKLGFIQEINSQSDPAWIELVLMQELGLVPEGYRKVVFPN